MDIYDDIDPLLRELGRLVFNTLEHSVRRLAWNLIDSQDERAGQIVTDTLGAARLEDLARVLLTHKPVGAALQERAQNLLQRFVTIRDRRNDFVHAIWRVPNAATDLSNMDAARVPTRKKAEYSTVMGSQSKDEVARVASEAASLDKQFELLLPEILAALRPAQAR